jgi:septal ring factor EnvC (AmiA/AmiB activator)
LPLLLRVRLALLAGAVGLFSFAPLTDAATRLELRKDELSGLRARIDSLRGELGKAEESRSEVADQLREGEVAISVAARRLNELSESRQTLSAELLALDRQIRALDQSTAVEQAQLARLLNRQFVGGDSDALRLLLAGKDPNQAARDRYFLTRLSVAKAGLTKELRGVAEQKRTLREDVRHREMQIRDIETAHQNQHAQLLSEQQRRSALLEKIAGKVRSQRKEIGALQRDELRMTRLIEGLSKIAGRQRGAASQKRPKNSQVGAGKTAKSGKSSGKAIVSVPNSDPGNVAGAFGKLRGQLTLPVAGTIAGRFGKRREEGAGGGGGVWKGLFIRASEGTEIRTVANGTVVFSDWLRGFGNLLIVDHGDDFLSIYAFNQSLLRQVGETVKGGERVATAGNSGGNSESGLYFELRYQGQAFDPIQWMRR